MRTKRFYYVVCLSEKEKLNEEGNIDIDGQRQLTANTRL